MLRSKLSQKYIFRPGFINPGIEKKINVFLKAFKIIYKICPFLVIDAKDLAKIMVYVATNGFNKMILENSDMRRLKLNEDFSERST